MARKLPSYTQDNLAQVGKMTSQIAAPRQGASDIILDRYNADPDATTVGRDLRKNLETLCLSTMAPLE
jgi:hypothetical protein